MGIITRYQAIRDNLKSQYNIPEKNALTEKDLDRYNLSEKDKNFLDIIRNLTIRGECTINDMVGMPKQDRTHPMLIKYQIYTRILNGSKQHKMIGLAEEETDKDHNKIITKTKKQGQKTTYKLNTMGILFAIEIFFDVEIHQRHMKRLLKDHSDFSKEPGTIIHKLAKNYPKDLPLIFDIFDNLEKHPKIYTGTLYEIITRPETNYLTKIEAYRINPFYKDMQIAFAFYWDHLNDEKVENPNTFRINDTVDEFTSNMYKVIKDLVVLEMKIVQRDHAKYIGDLKYAKKKQEEVSVLFEKMDRDDIFDGVKKGIPIKYIDMKKYPELQDLLNNIK